MELGNSVKLLISNSVRGSMDLGNSVDGYIKRSLGWTISKSVGISVWFPVRDSVRNLEHLK